MIMAAASVQDDETKTRRKPSFLKPLSHSVSIVSHSTNIEADTGGFSNPAFVDDGKSPQNVATNEDNEEENEESFTTQM